MIQRIQSIYLAIAGLAGMSSIYFGFVNNQEGNSSLENAMPFAGFSLGVLCFVVLFTFKNRKLQQGLCNLAFFLTLLLIMTGCYLIMQLPEGSTVKLSYYIWAVMAIGLWLAKKAIAKDAKLVKSMDSFR